MGLGNSDHNMIEFEINIKYESKNNYTKVPNFRRANFNTFRERVSEIPWNNIFISKTTNEQWEILLDTILTAQNESVPLKRKRTGIKNNPKWYSVEIGRLIKDRNNAHKNYTRTKSEADLNVFTERKRNVKSAVKVAKRNYERNIAGSCKENPKKFFEYVNNRNPVKCSIGPILDENAALAYDDVIICDILNKYFASVFTNENEITLTTAPFIRNFLESEKLVDIDIKEENVRFYIDKLKASKSPGTDAIHAIVLKELKDILTKPLTDIFNSSINNGEIPAVFKCANITPIFKKGDKKLPSNYQPISLTSLVEKLQESIIRDHLVNHLKRYNLIRASQHGFRNNKSCLTNLLEFFNKVINDYDNHRAVDVIYLDFRKAFDLVPHKKLLLKLKAHGIDGNVLEWIKEWLTERKQRVVINGIESSYVPVTSGVPQGSVLGPILFIIYVNDLNANVLNNIAKFADDTKISGIADNLESCESIQSDLNKIIEWSSTWGMDS